LMTPCAYRLTVAAMRPNARFWHEAAKSRMSAQRSLLEAKRTCRGHRKNDVLDPKPTSARSRFPHCSHLPGREGVCYCYEERGWQRLASSKNNEGLAQGPADLPVAG